MKKLIFVFICLVSTIPCSAGIIYVDDDASGANTGSSWDNAYNYLQDALTAASSGDEIRVAQGIYKPDQGAGVTPGDREATFQLINGVAIKGGYAGTGQPDPNARDIELYETILSGDLNGDDVDVNDPCDLLTEPTRAENSYHVVTGSGTNPKAVLDGFAIAGGNANVYVIHVYDGGGGMYNNSGSPTVIDCIFTGNAAGDNPGGGGMTNWNNSCPVLTNCIFKGNSASGSHNASGGGMRNERSSPTLYNCLFVDNWAEDRGGGMFNWSSSPTLVGCTFINNVSWERAGGGIFNYSGSSLALTNCTFTRNHTYAEGGGMYSGLSSNLTLTNCLFEQNSAKKGGGGIETACSPRLTNCTFIENLSGDRGGGMHYGGSGSPVLTNCTFTRNRGSRGGGMYSSGGDLTLVNCTFTDNLANSNGGLYVGHSSATIASCIFSGNSAEERGGALKNWDANSTVTNCVFSGNLACYGGAIWTIGQAPVLTNCTFTGNRAIRYGAVIYHFGAEDEVVLNNCILWGNSDNSGAGDMSQIRSLWSMPIINYSCIQGWSGIWQGTGNRSEDPLFVAPGRWDDGNTPGDPADDTWLEGDYKLQPGSPCIDAGDNMAVPPSVVVDVQGNPRFVDDPYTPDTGNGTPPIVEMGAYEGPKEGPFFLLSDRSVTVPEGGTATFTVALAFDPLGTVEVKVPLQSGDLDITIESSTTLIFDSSNYYQPQTVTIAAAEDEDYLNGKAIFPVTAPGFITAQVTAAEADNELFPTVIYVDPNAPGANNGVSWTDAFTELQDALSIAVAYPQVGEVRVAQGIYKPDQGAESLPGKREAAFRLIDGVAIKGGYAGFGERHPNTRDIKAYNTILSGDLNGDDGPGFMNYEENTYQIVVSSGNNATAVLDGFIISGGNANGDYDDMLDRGGGIYNYYSNSTILNCTFTRNWGHFGGGMRNDYGGNPTLTNCTFLGNAASAGGGMWNEDSGPTLSNCLFIGNTAANTGAGIFNNDNSSPILTNCTFSANVAVNYGGGMCNYHRSNPVLTNCTFTGNLAWYGGGMYNDAHDFPCNRVLTNCIFIGNWAANRGGGIYNIDGNLTLTNCILWCNTDTRGLDRPEQIVGRAAVSYSDVQGGWPGEGNIDADPRFVEPGNWDANSVWIDGDYHLLSDSPCIDAGDPNYIAEPNETDLDGKPRIIGGRIDMGAYESPIFAEARIIPRTINLASKGNWITCYIWLGEDYDVADIDPNNVLLEYEIQPESLRLDEEQQVAIAKFNRSEVQDILSIGEVELTITGQLTDGTIFEATDVIRVPNKAGLKSAK